MSSGVYERNPEAERLQKLLTEAFQCLRENGIAGVATLPEGIRKLAARSAPEPSERQPDGYAYRYPDGYIRFSGGREVNGSDPVETIPYYFRRAPEPRGEDVADKLWKMCVEDGWPWSEGAIQDQLTELGLLYAKDMTAEDSGPECTNCEGDCRTCYRAVEHVRDAKPLPLPLTKGGAL